MTERRAMGRGLAALIPSAPPAIDLRAARTAPAASPPPPGGDPAPIGAVYREVPIDELTPNPRQPREVFDEEALAELTHSIREIGLLQPIVVRAADSPGERAGGPAARWEIVAGERRWRASRQAGLTIVPVIVRQTADPDLLTEALLENLHRADLNALEEAAAYSQLLQDFGCTQEQLARRLGRSRSQVTNTLRLLKLPVAVQRRVAAGVLSAGHARALLGLDDQAQMESLATRIVAEGLSVRAVEEIVTVGVAGDDGDPEPPRRRRAGRPLPVEVDEVAHRLSDRYDTRVRIALGARKGRLTIEFGSIDDLARIVALMEGRQWQEAAD